MNNESLQALFTTLTNPQQSSIMPIERRYKKNAFGQLVPVTPWDENPGPVYDENGNIIPMGGNI